MDTSEALKEGRLDDALAAAKDAVRKAPSDTAHRSVLFQLYCVMGNWDGAQTQLKVFADLDPSTAMFAGVCEKLLACEAERRAVFAGQKEPTFFGKPPEWVGSMVEAFKLGRENNWQAAAASQGKALESAPAIAARVNNQEVSWLADGDSRFGPLLEAYVEGRYYWVPFEHVREVRFRQRTHLMDTIWAPVDFEWLNEGKAAGYIPVRYPGSETHSDPLVRLGRKTDWEQKEENFYLGQGHRSLVSSDVDFALSEVRDIKFTHPDVAVDWSKEGSSASIEGASEN